MVDLKGFDAEVVEPTSTFDIIPDGEYLAMMIDSEEKPTKSGDGKYLQLTWEIVDGEHKGRRLWDRLNVDNKNDTAVKIAMGTLSAICRAVGVMKPKDSSELHEKPCLIKVITEERSDKPGVKKNEIKGYAAKNGKTETSTKTTTDTGKKPWQK
jgi:hypothetical protein